MNQQPSFQNFSVSPNHSPTNFREDTPAPHGKRMVAAFLDLTLIGVLTGLTHALLPGFPFSRYLGFLYYLGFQSRGGRTPGKMLMGLQVVSADTYGEPSFRKLFLREGIGRFIAVVTLIGYPMILFDDKSRGLHDRVSDTLVISDGADDNESIGKGILYGCVGLFAILVACVYTLLYTNIPLTQMASNMAAQGVKIEGIKGSLARGFSIARIDFENENVKMSGEDLAFTYSDVFKGLQEHKIHIQAIDSAKYSLVMKHWPSHDDAKKAPAKKELAAKDKPQVKLALVIDQVDLNNLEFINPEGKRYAIERFYINNFVANDDKVSVEQIFVSSNLGTASIKEISLEEQQDVLVHLKQADLVISKSAMPEYLVGDVDFSLTAEGNWTKKSYSANIVGLRKSLTIKSHDKDLSITTTDFHPYWYFANMLPIETFNVQFVGSQTGILEAANWKGNYTLRGRAFALTGKKMLPQALFTGVYTDKNRNYFSTVVPGDKTTPLKILLNADQEDVAQALGAMYFAKPVKDVLPAESGVIAADLKYFIYQKVPGALAPAPLPSRMISSDPRATLPLQKQAFPTR